LVALLVFTVDLVVLLNTTLAIGTHHRIMDIRDVGETLHLLTSKVVGCAPNTGKRHPELTDAASVEIGVDRGI